MTNIPIIDHSVLSPSGRVSKRHERWAKDRITRQLFPDGFPEPKGPEVDQKTMDLRKAQTLEDLANRGMKPRAYKREAEKLRAKWA